MNEQSGFRHRRFPRFATRHRVQATTHARGLCLVGLLCDLSQEGCRLELDGHLAPGTPIEVHCDVCGLALCLRGEVVWVDALNGLLHGVAISGFASEGDAQFHHEYLDRLARETATPLGSDY